MSSFLKILNAIIALLTILLLTRVTIIANFQKENGKKSKSSAFIYFFGGILRKNLLISKPPKSTGQSEDTLSFFEEVKLYYSYFLEFIAEYKKSAVRLRRTVHAKKILLDVNFGMGDAAKTGISTGYVWSGIYTVISFIASLVRITKPQINVEPDFNQLKCDVNAEIIVKTSLISFIFLAINFRKSYANYQKIKIRINYIHNKII